MTLRPFSVSHLRALSLSTALTALAVIGLLATSAVPRDTPHNVDGLPAPAAGPTPPPPVVSLTPTYGFSAVLSASTPTNTDGVEPSGLVPDGLGNFLGAADNGGANADGTIFKVGPDGSFSVLHTFTGSADGSLPTASLTPDGQGNFYGTTSQGGPNGGGVVYKIAADGTGYTVVHAFASGSEGGDTDGTTPQSSVVLDANGNLYGTTVSGGGEGGGTVYQITPGGTFNVLYRFGGGSDGYYPVAALVSDGQGGFLGLTAEGGDNGSGTIYRITPGGAYTLLYTFSSHTSDGPNNDGASPDSALVSDGNGNFYGVAPLGGLNSEGTVFKFTTDGTLTGSVLTTLYSFTATSFNPNVGLDTNNDGANPEASLLYGLDGNLYGTAANGGTAGYGTIFEITPDGTVFQPLYAFTAGDDGANPVTSLTQLTTTDFYGTTAQFSTITPAARFGRPAPKPQGTSSNMNGTVFHLSVIPAAGVVQITGSYMVNENAGSVTIRADRLNGTTGAITVPYGTSDSTAMAGTDYTATAGTLTWADGDATPKFFTVPIIDRRLTGTGSRAFVVSLGRPTGGAVLAGPSDTSAPVGVTIVDNDVPAPVITSSLTASGQVGMPLSYQIVASNAPTAYTATGLPPGLTLNGVTGLISGTPTTAKIYSAVLTAGNAEGSGSLTVTFTIAAATIPVPVITSSGTATATVGVPFAYQITASNSPASFGTSPLPDGLTASIATGLISGTPTTVGSYTITLSAANAGGTGRGTLQLAIAAAQSQPTLAITSPPDGITVVVGESVPLSASITDADSTVTGVQFLFNNSASTDVSGANGQFTATATVPATAIGTAVPVTVTAQDAAGRTFSAVVHVNVVAADPANPLPTVNLLTPINNRFIDANAVLTLTATADTAGLAGLDHVSIIVNGQVYATFDAIGNLLTSAHGGGKPVRQDAASTPLSKLFSTTFPMPGIDKLLTMIVTATDKLNHTTVSPASSFTSRKTTDKAPSVSFSNASALMSNVVVNSVNPVNIVASDPDAGATSAVAKGPARQDAASDATLAELEYWINGERVQDAVKASGMDTSALNYSFSPPAVGKYVFHAVSTDASGLATVSDPVILEAVAAPPVVTVTALGDKEAVEGGEVGKVSVQRTGDLSSTLTVRYKVVGSAKRGTDYKGGPITDMAIIPPGATSVKVKIKPVDNTTVDGTRVAKIKLLPSIDPNNPYTLGITTVAKIRIIDND